MADFYGPWGPGPTGTYRIWERVTVSQNIGNNQSTVTVVSYMRDRHGFGLWDNSFRLIVTIGGTQVRNQNINVGFDGAGDRSVQLATNSRTFTHNSSGNHSNVTATVRGYTSFSLYDGTASGSVALPRINQFPSAPGTPTASQPELVVTVTSGTANGNGNSILEYQIRRRNNSGGSYGSWTTVSTGTGRTMTFTPAYHGVNYQFQSRARTSRGWGPWSGTRTITTKTQIPSKPGTPSVDVGTSSFTITSAVASPNGVAVSSYDIEYRHYANGTWSDWFTFNQSSRSRTVTVGHYGTNHQVRTRGRTSYGAGPYSDTVTFATRPLSNQPTIDEITPSSFRVRFSPNGRQDGSTTWQIEYSTNSSFSGSVWVNSTGTTTITGLSPMQDYYVRVWGTNSSGRGPSSPVRQTTTPPGSAPSLTVVGNASGTTATATVSIQGIGSPTYHLEWEYVSPGTPPAGQNGSRSSSNQVIQVENRRPGATYRFRAWVSQGSYDSPKSDWVTLIMANPGSLSSEYYDGTTPASENFTYGWSGTAHGSVSRAQAPRINSPLSSIYQVVGKMVSSGNHVGRLEVLYDDQHPVSPALGQADVNELIPYTFSAYLSSDEAIDLDIRSSFFDDSPAVVGTFRSPIHVPGGNVPTRVSASFTSPQGAKVAGFELSVPPGSSWVGGTSITVDGAMLTVGGLIPYFDGGMDGSSEFTYEWLGAPNDSPSLRTPIQRAFVDPFEDPNCPRPPLPPRPPAIENPCIDEVTLWRRYWVHLPASDVSAWLDTLPTFTIRTGAEAAPQVRIRIYENPLELPASEYVEREWVSEQVLTNLPPNSEIVLDGLTERARGRVGDSDWVSVDHLLYSSDGSPATWPVLGCGTAYLVAFDTPIDSTAGNLSFSAEVTNRIG